MPATLVGVGILDSKNPNKTSIVLALRTLPSTSLDSYEKVAAAIAAQQADIKARKDKQAAALARHAALMAKVNR